MQALVQFGKGENGRELRDVPEPAPEPDQVKIEVKGVGVCGTDLHGHPSMEVPVVLGHEVSGVVVELGSATKTRKVGERVTTETTCYVCEECRFCKTGHYNLCLTRRGLATKSDGAYAKYFVIREASTHVLPDHVSFSAGALCEPLACATHAVIEQAEISKGEITVVVGPGPLGLLVTQVIKARGGHVTIAGMPEDAPRLALAEKFGAERIVDVTKENLAEVVKSMTDGYGADTVFECSGAPPAVKGALDCVRKRGKYIQAGILHKNIDLDFDDVFFGREIVMLGTHTQKPSSWKLALDLLANKQVDLQPLVSDELPLSQWEEGFAKTAGSDAIKIVIQP